MTRREQVENILNEHPQLHDGGYGGLRGTELASGRAALLTPESVLTIDDVCVWLAGNIKPTCTINRRHTSYGLKHIHEGCTHRYSSNGQFIVAALIRGYRADLRHYNPCFAMGERSIRAAWDHANRVREAVTA